MQRPIFIILLGLSIVLRFFYFGEALDSPHTWRQSDTANYIHDFYHNGIDLFHPSVCWMGGHQTTILEFPLPEAIVAGCYHVFGESHLVARFIFLFFFLGCSWAFFRFVRLFYELETARISTLIFVYAPLALFYSRAIHIDFFALGTALLTGVYFTLGYRQEKWQLIALGSLMATFTFLIKVPYALVVIPVIIGVIFQEKNWTFVWKTIGLVVFPVLVFWGWQKWTFFINNSAPDLDYVIGYRKMIDNGHWYFGSWEQRSNWDNWQTIVDRLRFEILGWTGIIFLGVGLFVSFKKRHLIPLLSLVGVLIYWAIFFNLNLIHNYYQIPFLVPLAILVGSGISYLHQFFPKYQWIPTTVVLVFAIRSGVYAEQNYYQIQHHQIEIGEYIRQKTVPSDLIIINYGNIDNKCPNYLYRARRNGWHVLSYELKANAIYRLMKEQSADCFVYIDQKPPWGELAIFLSRFEADSIALQSKPEKVYLYQLDLNRLEPKD